jgi:23S rRNA G2445 N2-methylase RlmL
MPKLQRALPYFICTDLNRNALACSLATSQMNQIPDRLNFINCDLVSALRLSNIVDVLIFNPPYVPTENAASDNLVRFQFQCKQINLIYFRSFVMPEVHKAQTLLTDFFHRFQVLFPSQMECFI